MFQLGSQQETDGTLIIIRESLITKWLLLKVLTGWGEPRRIVLYPGFTNFKGIGEGAITVKERLMWRKLPWRETVTFSYSNENSPRYPNVEQTMEVNISTSFTYSVCQDSLLIKSN